MNFIHAIFHCSTPPNIEEDPTLTKILDEWSKNERMQSILNKDITTVMSEINKCASSPKNDRLVFEDLFVTSLPSDGIRRLNHLKHFELRRFNALLVHPDAFDQM